MPTYVKICTRAAAMLIPSNGPQKSPIELFELTWHVSPNRNDTPVIVIVTVKRTAAMPHPTA